mmetsp:Transcript_28714/g.70008  ORF Transcript_28714/g.70008 Transcript_28714/m.70008 type:complete len:1252 (+) Transcript_28714:52-3807(+)
MAKRRHGRPARPRKKRGQSGRGDGVAQGDLDDGARMVDDDFFSQGFGSEYFDGADSLLAWHSKFLTSLRKNFAYWIILVLTVSAALTWLTYFTFTSTGIVKGLAAIPLFKSDAIAFYHPNQNSYVACVEQPPLHSRGGGGNGIFRYRVKEPLDVYPTPSSDNVIALAEPGDTITILERKENWIRHARGLTVEGWSKLEPQQTNASSPATSLSPPDSSSSSSFSSLDLPLWSKHQFERSHDTESLLLFECYCAGGSGRGSSKLVSPYRMVLTKKEIPEDTIWRIPLFAQSALYDRARLMGSNHGCIWCSDALLLGLSPIIWTFVNLPLGLFISLGTLLTDLVAFEFGEMWSLVILCTGFMWFCLCLLATYALELRSASYELVLETRWWLQLQFLTRPFLDLLILSVGVFLVGPCLAIPIYIFLLIRFYSLPAHTHAPGGSTGDPAAGLPVSPSVANSRTSSASMDSSRNALLGGVTASALSQGTSAALGGATTGDPNDEAMHKDDTQVIYTCSLLRDRFLTDHIVMTAIFVTVCLTSHAFRVFRLFPDVRWIAVPQLYLFYCILKRGTQDGYIAICFAWQCFGLAFSLRTGGWVSYVVYVVFCKDFDHPNSNMPWREHTLKQIIAIGCFSLACGAVGVVPALLMFLTTLAKNPKAYLSANREEINAAVKAKKGQKAKGLLDAPDYCRVVADFLVKFGLVLMARALVSEFRCSRWLDFNITNFLTYVVDVDIDNRTHMSLLTILGGGVATSIARRNWIPNLCWYAAGGRTILKFISCHKESSYQIIVGTSARDHPDEKHRKRLMRLADEKKSSKSTGTRKVPTASPISEQNTFPTNREKYTSARSKFVAHVESTISNPNARSTAFVFIFSLAFFYQVPVMCLLPLMMPDPWEQLLGPSFWTLVVFFATLLSHMPSGFLAAFDLTILGFGFMSWALKDYDEGDLEDDELFMQESIAQPTERKLSVAQKLKIGLEDRAIVGDVKAQFQMANLYAREGDTLKAADWYRQAANHGSKEAQFAVANAYLEGNGVERDEKLAMWWYDRAAEQGLLDAKKKIAALRESKDGKGYKVTSDRAQEQVKDDLKGDGVGKKDESGKVLKHVESNQSRSGETEDAVSTNRSLLMLPSNNESELGGDDSGINPSSSMIHRGIFCLEVGTSFWGFISHSKLWRMPVKVEGKITGGIYPNFIGEWTAIGKVTCESQTVFINIKAYGVVILGDRTTQAHLIFVADGRMEGEVFQEGVPGGSAVLEVQTN